MKCWASKLGNCKGPQSSEHIFSAALFKGNSVEVYGGPFPVSGKKIALKGLTSNVLCHKHNNDLSMLDCEAGKFAKSLSNLDKMHARRGR